MHGNAILQRYAEGKRMRLMPNLADFSSRRDEWKRTFVVLVGYTSPGSCTKHTDIGRVIIMNLTHPNTAKKHN
jgi:hypothetical protein